MFLYSMWATQYTPNNVYANVPGVLSDGRTFTDYSQMNDQIKREHRITTNEEYRKFLVKHADTIMQYNFDTMIQRNPSEYPSVLHGPPHFYNTMQDDSKPYGYEDSGPKQNYLSREQLDDKKRRLYKENY